MRARTNEAITWSLAESQCPSGQFPVGVRVDADGNVLESRGDAGQLASLAAYVTEVAQLVGGELGFGRFLALQSVDADQQIVIGLVPSGEMLAVCGPRRAASAALCRKLDL